MAWGRSSRTASAQPAAVAAHFPRASCRRRGATPRVPPRHFAAPFRLAQQGQARETDRGERGGLDHRHGAVAVQFRRDDLRGHDAEASAEDVGRRERRERRHEGQKGGPGERGREQRQRDPPRRAGARRAEARRGFQERPVRPRQARPGEEVEVHVHGVGVHEEDRAGAGEPPWRLGEAEERLRRPRGEAALAVQEEECEDADERRQRDRQRDEGAEQAPPGKLVALEEKREGHADRAREHDRRERDPETRPERLPLGRARREFRHVRKRPVRRAERLGERQDEGIADEPEEQQRQERSGEAPPRTAQGSLGNTRGAGPSGAGTTWTRSPSRAASGAASTSSSPAEPVATRK